MNLKEHRQTLYRYESLLKELKGLKNVPLDTGWKLVPDLAYNDYCAEIPLTDDDSYAKYLILTHMSKLDTEIKELADKLGITE